MAFDDLYALPVGLFGSGTGSTLSYYSNVTGSVQVQLTANATMDAVNVRLTGGNAAGSFNIPFESFAQAQNDPRGFINVITTYATTFYNGYQYELPVHGPQTHAEHDWDAASLENREWEKKQRVKAQHKARALLIRHLDAEQQNDLKRYDFFRVTGSSGRHFVVQCRPDGNQAKVYIRTQRVYHKDISIFNDKYAYEFCCADNALGLPVWDDACAKLLLLQACDTAFLSVAVRSGVRVAVHRLTQDAALTLETTCPARTSPPPPSPTIPRDRWGRFRRVFQRKAARPA